MWAFTLGIDCQANQVFVDISYISLDATILTQLHQKQYILFLKTHIQCHQSPVVFGAFAVQLLVATLYSSTLVYGMAVQLFSYHHIKYNNQLFSTNLVCHLAVDTAAQAVQLLVATLYISFVHTEALAEVDVLHHTTYMFQL